MTEISTTGWLPRAGWALVGTASHPSDESTRQCALIRHHATGVYRLDDGLALRSIPQDYARQHDTTRNPAAVALGCRGGQATSPAKTAAARRNAKRPRPRPKTE